MDENNENEVAIDVAALGEKFEEKNYFRRLLDMFKGLKKPKNTAEYKLARLELQRQQAPLIAVVSVVLLVVILIVVTKMKPPAVQKIVSTQLEEKQEEPQEEEKKEEEPPPPDPEDTPVEFEMENPMPGPPTDMTTPTPAPNQPVSVSPAPVESVHNVVSPVKMRSMVGSRTPGTIGAKTRGGKGDGDTTTEAAVLKVLWWLKATQSPDGSWKNSRDGGTLANTSFAILTYLAHGEYPGSDSPHEKDFGPVVKKAIQYVMGCVEETSSGVRMKGSDENEYAFLIATYAMCEAFGMIKNPDIKEVALKCLERIVKSQSPTGGWDYHLDKAAHRRDDVSLGGWAIQALKAGKLSGLKPEGLDECIKKAINCLAKRNYYEGTFLYRATDRKINHPGLAGVGCLAMQLLGYGGQKEVASSLAYMRDWMPTFEKGAITHKGKTEGSNYCPQYYCYYATQCKYQAGMKEGAKKEDTQTWYEWNKAMKSLYTTTIKELDTPVKDWSGQNHKQGYYENKDQFSSRPYMDSCLVALQLMVYYRYLPTTQTSAAKEDAEEDSSSKAVDGGDVRVEDIDL